MGPLRNYVKFVALAAQLVRDPWWYSGYDAWLQSMRLQLPISAGYP